MCAMGEQNKYYIGASLLKFVGRGRPTSGEFGSRQISTESTGRRLMLASPSRLLFDRADR